MREFLFRKRWALAYGLLAIINGMIAFSVEVSAPFYWSNIDRFITVQVFTALFWFSFYFSAKSYMEESTNAG